MKITVFAFDVPYPPTSGGRLDIWTQCMSLLEHGHTLQLWCFTDVAPAEEAAARFREIDHLEAYFLPFSDRRKDVEGVSDHLRFIWRKLLSLTPSCCSQTRLNVEKLAFVLDKVLRFSPQFVVAHGIQTLGAVYQIAPSITVPWLYRSHNHETYYYLQMAKAERAWVKKLNLYWQSARLSWYEPRVLAEAHAVLHISYDEYRQFREKDFANQYWVPPVYDFKRQPASPTPRWDVGILSSWFASQKREGLRWFVRAVRPRLAADIRICVAGSSAPDWLPALCAENGIAFVGKVESSAEFYSQCRVLLNPVLSGAGVNMKIIEMLRSGRPVVTTGAGIAGLPPQIARWVYLENEASGFAVAIKRALTESASEVPEDIFAEFTSAHFNQKMNNIFSEILRSQTEMPKPGILLLEE